MKPPSAETNGPGTNRPGTAGPSSFAVSLFGERAVDGNAIGGQLREIFGEEMTTAIGICIHCGATGPLAETVVYLNAPGTVVRCRRCTNLLMVLVRVRQWSCVDMLGLASLQIG